MINFYEFKQIVENHPFDSIVKATNRTRSENINNIFNNIVQAQSKIEDIQYEFSEIYKKADELFAMKDDARAEDTGDYEELVGELNRLIKLLSNCDEQNSKIINLFSQGKFKQ
jgi:predicted transcriptional regulator